MRTKPSHRWTWIYLCLVCTGAAGCSGPNHDALCDKALVEAHIAYENKDYQHASDLLKVAAKEADLSDASVHKHHVLREQVMVALAQNDSVDAEKFARQLVEFEKAQEHVGNNASWRQQWAEDMTRAEMLLGDSLHAENKKREALEVYKAAVMHANQSVAPVPVSVTASERYVQTLKELGLGKGELITDPGAAAEAVEDYNDVCSQMYACRSSKDWKKLIVTADKTAASAAECKLYDGGVTANGLAAQAEFLLGDNAKAREYAERALKIAGDHPTDSKARQNSAGGWILLAATDSNETQAKREMFNGYTTDWQQAESTRFALTSNLDQTKWNQIYDRFMELRLGALHLQNASRRHERWGLWVGEYQLHNRLANGVVWLEKMYAHGEIDGQDLADAYEAILTNPKLPPGIDTKSWRRKILQIREGLYKREPTNRFNLAHLADAYHFMGQNNQALKLARAAQNGLNPADPFNQYIDAVIKQSGGRSKTPE